MKLPSDFLGYMRADGILKAFLTEDFVGYMALWPLDEIHQCNAEIEVEKYAPGFVGFGTNGGGELLAFDEAGAVYSLPMIGLSAEDAVRIAGSWREFESRIQRDG